MVGIFDKKPEIIWNYKVKNIIWRVLPFHDSLIVGEVRDTTNKDSSFFCLESASGKILWSDIKFEEPWWIGIDDISSDVIIFHKFAQPDLPLHKQIIAVDIRSGNVLWTNYEVSFICTSAEYLFGNKEEFDRKINFQINILTGEIVKELTPDDIKSVIEKSKIAKHKYFQSPDIFSIDRIANPVVISFIQKQKNTKLIESIEYLKVKSYFIIGLCENISSNDGQNKIIERVIILDENGEKLFTDTIIESGNLPMLPNYFVKDNILYYVKNKNKLNAIRI